MTMEMLTQVQKVQRSLQGKSTEQHAKTRVNHTDKD